MRVGVLPHCRESSWNPLAVLVLKERGQNIREKWDTPRRLDGKLTGEIDVNRPLVVCIVLYLCVKLDSYVSLPQKKSKCQFYDNSI